MKIQILDLPPMEVKGFTSLEDVIELGGSRKVDHAKRTLDLGNNCAALQHLLKGGTWEDVTDHCAGIGLWAHVVNCELGPFKLELRELDPACAKHLVRQYPTALVRRVNSFSEIAEGNVNPHLNLLDWTKCTIKTIEKAPWADGLFSGAGDVVLSDCAGAKIHMNYKTYGLTSPSYSEYMKSYAKYLHRRFGYGCVAAVSCGGKVRPNSGYLLLSRVKRQLKFRVANVSASAIK